MAEFGGWDMPIEYSGIVQEHMAVRTAAGLFDISHMGEVQITGPQSLDLMQKLSCNDASRLHNGQIHYSALLYEEGTFVDDILVHRLGPQSFLICVNASNTDKDFEWISQWNDADAQVTNASEDFSQLALQGPKAVQILQRLTGLDLNEIRYYWFREGQIQGVDCLVSRTGYTGEDGFELYFAPEFSDRMWNLLLTTGANDGLVPVGLGARNTLRLEAKMALYGHEISQEITPWEADLAWIVKMNKGDFVGRAALSRQREIGVTRKLVGFEMIGRGIGRDGYPVFVNNQQCGIVTSGGPSPFLKKNIGLAYLPVAQAKPGTKIGIQVRRQMIDAVVVETPFYKRGKS